MKFKNLLYPLLLILISLNCFAQKKEFNKIINKALKEANYYYEFDNFHLALPFYHKVYELDSTIPEVNFRLGVCIYTTKRDNPDALTHFEESKTSYIDAYFYLGNIYHNLEEFDKSISHYQHYYHSLDIKTFDNNYTSHLSNKSLTAKELKLRPENVWLKNIGDEINSPYPDYAPIISPDEKSLYFTSRRKGSTGGLLDPYDEFFEDIYIANKKNGDWGKTENISYPINSKTHDACVTMSLDGKHIYIYRTNNELTAGDIYLSSYCDGVWSIPKKIDADINSKEGVEASACFSPDQNTLYFSSNRDGGYGGKDIYTVKKLPNGEWSLAQNMGPVINSPYDEDAPFIHPEGHMLFFSSKGHRNMGGYDIFRCTLNENNEWATPENIGYPINSVKDDIYFVTTKSKEYGYFSSNRKGGVGLSDIYMVDLPDNMVNFAVISGYISYNDTLKNASATLTLLDNNTKKLVGIYQPNKRTGRFIIITKPGNSYKVIIEAEGYQTYIKEFELTNSNFNEILKKIILERIRSEECD